jgi:hypothetical protein
MFNKDELIENWKRLNKQADKLLDKHTSFRAYNNVRLKMDNIERILSEEFNINVYKI